MPLLKMPKISCFSSHATSLYFFCSLSLSLKLKNSSRDVTSFARERGEQNKGIPAHTTHLSFIFPREFLNARYIERERDLKQ
jgi:hypothetical protein